MKTFICNVAFHVEGSLLQRSITELHSVKFYNGKDYQTLTIEKFMEEKPSVQFYVNVFGDAKYFDFSYSKKIVFLEFA